MQRPVRVVPLSDLEASDFRSSWDKLTVIFNITLLRLIGRPEVQE